MIKERTLVSHQSTIAAALAAIMTKADEARVDAAANGVSAAAVEVWPVAAAVEA